MKPLLYGLGLMLLGIIAGLVIDIAVGLAVMAIGAAFLLYALIATVESGEREKERDLETRADDVRRQHNPF